MDYREHVEGSKRSVTTFALASIEAIPTKIFMIAIETTFIVIDCIGNYYHYDDNSKSYPTLAY